MALLCLICASYSCSLFLEPPEGPARPEEQDTGPADHGDVSPDVVDEAELPLDRQTLTILIDDARVSESELVFEDGGARLPLITPAPFGSEAFEQGWRLSNGALPLLWPVEGGLIARWRFDEASWGGDGDEVIDDIGGANGTLRRGATQSSEARTGGAAHFAGDGAHIDVGASPFGSDAPFALTAWIKHDAPGRRAHGTILGAWPRAEALAPEDLTYVTSRVLLDEPSAGDLVFGVFDGDYLFHVPFGKSGVNSTFLRLDVNLDPTTTEAWTTFESRNVIPTAGGYVGGLLMDDTLICIPLRNSIERRVSTTFLLYDTTGGFTDVGSWRTEDPTELGHPAVGLSGGVVVGRDVYFAGRERDGDDPGDYEPSGVMLKYSPDAVGDERWASFDAAALPNAPAGFYGATYDGRFVYFAGNQYPTSQLGPYLARYDTAEPFDSPESWRVLDSRQLTLAPTGLTGPLFDGERIYFSPARSPIGEGNLATLDPFGDISDLERWGSLQLPSPIQSSFTTASDGRYLYTVPNAEDDMDEGPALARVDTFQDLSEPTWQSSPLGPPATMPLRVGAIRSTIYDGRYIHMPSGLKRCCDNPQYVRYDPTGGLGGFALLADVGLQTGGLGDAPIGPAVLLLTDQGATSAWARAPLEPGWHHIAATYDGATTLALYIDGVMVDEATVQGNPLPFEAPLTIGGTRFDGLIDEVGIFDRALGSAEIGDMANGRDREAALEVNGVELAPGPAPHFGDAFSFDGDDDITARNSMISAAFAAPFDLTLLGWVNPVRVAGDNDAPVITVVDPEGAPTPALLPFEATLGADVPSGYLDAIDAGRYIYFAPALRESGDTHGRVLRYDTKGPIDQIESWSDYDVSSLDLGPGGFAGGVFDGRYVHFAPNFDGIALRHDTTAPFDQPEAWSTRDVSLIDGTPSKGYHGGAFDGRYVYFAPSQNETGPHGVVLRLDTTGASDDETSWSAVDRGFVGMNVTTGFRGGVFDGRYVYFTPNMINDEAISSILRYDTTAPFEDAAAWSSFAQQNLDPRRPGGFGVAAFDGRYIYYPPANKKHPVLLRYDTWGDFAAPASYTTIDARRLRGKADGVAFESAIYDGRSLLLIPSYDPAADQSTLLRYDPQRAAFDSDLAWTLLPTGFNLRAATGVATPNGVLLIPGDTSGGARTILRLTKAPTLTLSVGRRVHLELGSAEGALRLRSGDIGAADRWLHLAARLDASTARIYLDGELVDEAPMAIAPTFESPLLRVGGRWLSATLDDITLVGEALDDETIHALGSAGFPTTPALFILDIELPEGFAPLAVRHDADVPDGASIRYQVLDSGDDWVFWDGDAVSPATDDNSETTSPVEDLAMILAARPTRATGDVLTLRLWIEASADGRETPVLRSVEVDVEEIR